MLSPGAAAAVVIGLPLGIVISNVIARMVMQEFGVPWLRLRLSKPGAVAAAEDVGVIIEVGERP